MNIENIRLYRTEYVGYYRVKFDINDSSFESTGVHRGYEIVKLFNITPKEVDKLVKAIK